MRTVCLDGNPIGVQGSKALMAVPMAVGDRVAVTSLVRERGRCVDRECMWEGGKEEESGGRKGVYKSERETSSDTHIS